MEFQTNGIALSSVHLQDLDNTAHQVASEDYDESRVVRSCSLTNVTALSSLHLRDLDNTVHQVVVEEDDWSRILRSQILAFVPADVAQVVLEISPDGFPSPISEFAYQAYRIFGRSDFRAIDCSSDWQLYR